MLNKRKVIIIALSIILMLCIIISVNHKVQSKKVKTIVSITEVQHIQDEYKQREILLNQKIKEYEETISEDKNDNEELAEQCALLENTIKKYSSIGTRPKKYSLFPEISRGSFAAYRDKMMYVGKWLGTYYTPDQEECGKNDGITYSGIPVIPGYTIAIDKRYWKFGVKFYIEGIGIVETADIGRDIKGRNRFDLCTFSKYISRSGSFTAKVYLIEN